MSVHFAPRAREPPGAGASRSDAGCLGPRNTPDGASRNGRRAPLRRRIFLFFVRRPTLSPPESAPGRARGTAPVRVQATIDRDEPSTFFLTTTKVPALAPVQSVEPSLTELLTGILSKFCTEFSTAMLKTGTRLLLHRQKLPKAKPPRKGGWWNLRKHR